MPNITSYKQYTTRDGDTWDMLALAEYDDENLADLIMDFNPKHAGTIVFGAGETLFIPVLDQADNEAGQLPPWRDTE